MRKRDKIEVFKYIAFGVFAGVVFWSAVFFIMLMKGCLS